MHRSKPLRDSARDEMCVGCGRQDGTIVWAHGNELAFGKGKSIKCHDLLGNYLCMACHSAYDTGTMSREWKQRFFRDCYVKTMTRVAEKIAAGTLKL